LLPAAAAFAEAKEGACGWLCAGRMRIRWNCRVNSYQQRHSHYMYAS